MSGQRGPIVKVTLACTACQHVYVPNLASFDTGLTGCPLCGGWTWIAELGIATSPFVTDTSQNILPDPTSHSAKNARQVGAQLRRGNRGMS